MAHVSGVSELALFVVSESVPDVAEPQASGNIAVVFVALIPVFLVPVGVYNPGRPGFLSFPNGDYPANSSSSVELVGKESIHSSTGVRTKDGLCSTLLHPGSTSK